MKNEGGKVALNVDEDEWKHDKFDLNNKSPRSGEVINS
jgi:hypothetical protein